MSCALRYLYALAVLTAGVLAAVETASADPCGMVPPVTIGDEGIQIKRVGPQKTYVFYKNGVETFIIRPGYEGKIDEFGMLIPFPVPPAIRKAPDNLFEQITAAIDPPEVVVDLRPPPPGAAFGGFGGGLGGGGGFGGGGLGFAVPEDKVEVVREEAVGMYEVAVLAAGSAKALKKWLDEHKYQYPSGMDLPCNDYVKQGWCFVAVKTRVQKKSGADPEPGQRDVDAKLPEGAVFDGHVQAMQFRFPSRELVVPMRLSAFNEGETRNVVYLLADQPAKIRNIPEEFVVRQISGDKLFRNLTGPLPLRIIGGKLGDIPAGRLKALEAERNPRPHNGVAADIFAADLIAARTGKMLAEHEVREKELVAIGEELLMRGEAFDAAVGRALDAERQLAIKAGLRDLNKMALTIVDGDFPREVLAKNNLTFAEYKMPLRRSKPEFYDANLLGPGEEKQGVLETGSIDELRRKYIEQLAAADGDEDTPVLQKQSRRGLFGLMAVIGVALLLSPTLLRRKAWAWLVGLVFVAGALLAAQPAFAETTSVVPVKYTERDVPQLIKQFDNPAAARDAVEGVVQVGEPSVRRLISVARRGGPMPRRGWAIAALGQIGGDKADATLKFLAGDKEQPELIRLWAKAAYIQQVTEFDELAALLEEHKGVQALERPLAKAIERYITSENVSPDDRVQAMLVLTARAPQASRVMGKQILAGGPTPLVTSLLTSPDDKVRRQAAGYLATLGKQGDETVVAALAEGLQFDAMRDGYPWQGGALFLPQVTFSDHKEDAKSLARNLIAWHVWCGQQQMGDVCNQIDVNLGSTGLAHAVGYSPQGQNGVASETWLSAWKAAFGEEEVDKLLAEQQMRLVDGKLAQVR